MRGPPRRGYDTSPPLPPPDVGVEMEDVLQVDAGNSSGDSLYSPRAPSPFEDSEEEDPLPRGRLEVLLEAARDVGLSSVAAQAPPPPHDVWAGFSNAPSDPPFPVAQGFIGMLHKHWSGDSPAGGGKRFCAGIKGVFYSPESGLSWMPPIEQEVAILTSLPVGSVSGDPSHPSADGRVSDRQLTGALMRPRAQRAPATFWPCCWRRRRRR